ncbi:MAG: cell wall hydrolase [Lachnospiraceae bacterium]
MKFNIIIRTLIFILALTIYPVTAKAEVESTYDDDMNWLIEMSVNAVSAPELAGSFRQLTEASQPKCSYTEEDLYILAHVICGEAQAYSDEEQLYVGSVVLNRMNHSRYPDTIHGVVFQKNQYSCTRDGNYYRTPTERNWANARYLLENGSILPANVVYQSGGRQGKGVYLKTSRHYYCYY